MKAATMKHESVIAQLESAFHLFHHPYFSHVCDRQFFPPVGRVALIQAIAVPALALLALEAAVEACILFR